MAAECQRGAAKHYMALEWKEQLEIFDDKTQDITYNLYLYPH